IKYSNFPQNPSLLHLPHSLVYAFDFIYLMQIPTHMQKLSFILVLFLVQHMLIAQTRVKIVDSATAEAIPYANVNIAESQNLVSNAEGYFNIPDSFESGA